MTRAQFGNRPRQDVAVAKQINKLIAVIEAPATALRPAGNPSAQSGVRRPASAMSPVKIAKIIDIDFQSATSGPEPASSDGRGPAMTCTRDRRIEAPRYREPRRALTEARLEDAGCPLQAGAATSRWRAPHVRQDEARRLCRHVRPDHRRPRAARRHRPHRRGREGPHHLRRGGEVRRRQGDPRRHGPEPGHPSRARSTPSSPTR